MFDFTPPYLPLLALLVLLFLAVGGTIGTIVQYFRCIGNSYTEGRPNVVPHWVLIWLALAFPSWIGFLTINYILDAIRRGVY